MKKYLNSIFLKYFNSTEQPLKKMVNQTHHLIYLMTTLSQMCLSCWNWSLVKGNRPLIAQVVVTSTSDTWSAKTLVLWLPNKKWCSQYLTVKRWIISKLRKRKTLPNVPANLRQSWHLCSKNAESSHLFVFRSLHKNLIELQQLTGTIIEREIKRAKFTVRSLWCLLEPKFCKVLGSH